MDKYINMLNIDFQYMVPIDGSNTVYQYKGVCPYLRGSIWRKVNVTDIVDNKVYCPITGKREIRESENVGIYQEDDNRMIFKTFQDSIGDGDLIIFVKDIKLYNRS